ncbi:hypothetical protein NKH77_39615 [Streptomyces sp. M19]
MKKSLESLGFVLLIVGASGLAHHFVGGFRLWGVVRLIPFIDGHQVAASVVLVAVGLVLMIAPDEIAKRADRQIG